MSPRPIRLPMLAGEGRGRTSGGTMYMLERSRRLEGCGPVNAALRVCAALAAIVVLAGGCTVSHSLSLPPSQERNVASAAPISGRYAVHIDTRLLEGNLTVGGACKDVAYPMLLAGPFESRLRSAFSQRLETVEFVAQPLQTGDLRESGFAGQIVIASKGVAGLADINRASLSLKAGIEVRLDLKHRLRVEDADRRYRDAPLDTAATAQGEAVLDVCESVADTLGVAFGIALDRLEIQVDEGLAPLRAATGKAGS